MRKTNQCIKVRNIFITCKVFVYQVTGIYLMECLAWAQRFDLAVAISDKLLFLIAVLSERCEVDRVFSFTTGAD